jgi:hypothetical protein
MFWLDVDLGIIFCKQSVLTSVKAQFYLEFALFRAPFIQQIMETLGSYSIREKRQKDFCESIKVEIGKVCTYYQRKGLERYSS